jgi:hypothetical protein
MTGIFSRPVAKKLKMFLKPKIPELEGLDVYELSELEPSSIVIAGP